MSPDAILTQDELIKHVHEALTKRSKDGLIIEDVRRALEGLRLSDPAIRTTCQLRIQRLTFGGQKTLEGRHDLIRYQQDFKPGVNVVLIEDNDVGKSTIMKTIKYALTGDDGSYDADVKTWIKEICLQFCLDDEPYTVFVSCAPDSEEPLGTLCSGNHSSRDSVQQEQVVFVAANNDEFHDALRRFFFDRVGLSRLAWTLPPAKGDDRPRESGTTWLTYFQALQIPDGGDRYLLCDPEHAFGNQEGLIFSSFLGLHLVDQLNWLGVEASKQQRIEQGSDTERTDLTAQRDKLQSRSREVQDQLCKLNADFKQRQENFTAGNFQERFTAVQSDMATKAAKLRKTEGEIAGLSETLSFARARETQVRELLALKLHFTGLDVRLCPNCDAQVSEAEVRREYDSHTCRLCQKPAHDATAEEIVARRAEAEELAAEVKELEKSREDLKREASHIEKEINDLRQEAGDLEASAKNTLRQAVPTDAEQKLRDDLLLESGKLTAETAAVIARIEQLEKAGAFDANRGRVLKKARDILKAEAERRNCDTLTGLNDLTKELARLIGAESITDVTCSALGKIKLRKHDQEVSFTGIKNQGERMRVKLAFFLAMMRLGRNGALGRHPGLLLIDQPGSAEMVTEDFRALATVLRELDESLADQVQVLCFTARAEFKDATRPEKVYGPQAGKYAF